LNENGINDHSNNNVFILNNNFPPIPTNQNSIPNNLLQKKFDPLQSIINNTHVVIIKISMYYIMIIKNKTIFNVHQIMTQLDNILLKTDVKELTQCTRQFMLENNIGFYSIVKLLNLLDKHITRFVHEVLNVFLFNNINGKKGNHELIYDLHFMNENPWNWQSDELQKFLKYLQFMIKLKYKFPLSLNNNIFDKIIDDKVNGKQFFEMINNNNIQSIMKFVGNDEINYGILNYLIKNIRIYHNNNNIQNEEKEQVIHHCRYSYSDPLSSNATFPPLQFICPLSKKLIEDPVILTDGYTYEYKDIKNYLRFNDTSPVTGEKLKNKQTVSNNILKWMIQNHQQK